MAEEYNVFLFENIVSNFHIYACLFGEDKAKGYGLDSSLSIPSRARFFSSTQRHPASYPICTGADFPAKKEKEGRKEERKKDRMKERNKKEQSNIKNKQGRKNYEGRMDG
jgi:hypothetical protein